MVFRGLWVPGAEKAVLGGESGPPNFSSASVSVTCVTSVLCTASLASSTKWEARWYHFKAAP